MSGGESESRSRFPRFRFSNGTTRQNFAGFLKMTRLFETPAKMQKIRHFEAT
jgi:hypothetical protein